MKYVYFLILLLFPIQSYCAESPFEMNGNTMLEKCHYWFADSESPATTKVQAFDMGFCAGYFKAVMDMESAQIDLERRAHVEGPAVQFCRPEEVTNGQVFKIVKKWLDDNPDKLHWGGEVIIVKALSQAFPCKDHK